MSLLASSNKICKSQGSKRGPHWSNFRIWSVLGMVNTSELRPSSSAIAPIWDVADYTGSDNLVTSEGSKAEDS